DFRENASWVGSMQKFIVGEGGATLQHIDDSLSVLGHEYSHAIIQFSSGLAYRGQSGALNEHFADIQGATLDATINNGGKFRFTIGEEILTPAVKTEKAKILDLIFSNQKYSSFDIARFSLNQVGLRHLFAPMLSLSTQYDSLAELKKVYPDSCQPSVDNDNCGVHSASGLPNKAASMIISTLGLDETRSLFFNTLVYRLNPSSNFRDYLVQLVEECKATPKLMSKCDVIVSSFAQVGVTYPRPGEVSTPSPRAVPSNGQSVTSLLPVTRNASTPPLKFCGWVDKANDDRIRIFDDKYNGTIVKRNYDVKTQGDFSALQDSNCACVTGRLTQTTNARGEMINAFLDVMQIENRGNACELERSLSDKRPSKEPDHVDTQLDPAVPHYFCGWVSVNSQSRNVTIIDNKYDVALIASGYPNLTSGDYSEIYRNQCACAYGKIAQMQNSKGTTFNYLSTVEGKRVVYKAPEACVGIEWK
ncbi:MAG: M4 family metallopeptidase, partial [Bdellovibrionota bacterium]